MAVGPSAAGAATTVSYNSSTGVLVQGDAGLNGARVSEGTGSVTVAPDSISSKVTPEPLAAGAGCSLASGQVSCSVPSGGVPLLTFHGGDGNDFLDAHAYPHDQFVFGEGGNDTLTTGAGFDAVDGGAGNDSISTGAGNDSVNGNLGDDTIRDAAGDDTYNGGAGDDTFVVDAVPAGADTYRGGDGFDTVTYAARTTPVHVAICNTHEGFPGDAATPPENDNLGISDIEHVIGGSANDTLQANCGIPVTLDGGPGDDALKANASDAATLIGGSGADTLTGRNGPDHFLVRDGEQDTITSCGGSSFDSVIADLHDTAIPTNCESVDQGALHEGPNVVVLTRRAAVDRAGGVRVHLRCPRVLGRLGCHGTLSLQVDGARARGGSASRYAIRAGRTATVVATLSAGGLRALRRTRHPRLRLVSVERGHHGPKTTRRLLGVRS
jgi:Ca2+-binding RTX toxin-like protein